MHITMYFLKAAVILSVMRTVSSTVCSSAEEICKIGENSLDWTCDDLEMLREECIERLSEADCVNPNQLANDFFLEEMLSCPESSNKCLSGKIRCESKATQPDNLEWICDNLEKVKRECLSELIESKCDNSDKWVDSLFSKVIVPQCREFFHKCGLIYDKCEKKIPYHELTSVCNNLKTLKEECAEILSEAKCHSWKQWLHDQISRVKDHCPRKEQLTPIFVCLTNRSAIISEKTTQCTNENSLTYWSCQWQASRDCCPSVCELPTLVEKHYNTSEAIDACNSNASPCE